MRTGTHQILAYQSGQMEIEIVREYVARGKYEKFIPRFTGGRLREATWITHVRLRA
jgi:hypothetical protein